MTLAWDLIRGAMSAEDIALAASIGENKDKQLLEQITDLFESLPDPLVSAAEVKMLLGARPSVAKIEDQLRNLVTEGVLDESVDTQRPLDREGLRLFRPSSTASERLKLLALQEELVPGVIRYQLTVDGRLIRSLARVERLDAVSGKGQQRKEIKAHVERIAEGLRSGIHVPNPILLVLLDATTEVLEPGEPSEAPDAWTVITPFDEFVEMSEPGSGGKVAQRSRLVEIDLPFRHAAFDGEKSMLLVDGQQRTAALALVSLAELPVCSLTVNVVIGDESDAQQVFQVANDTVKIRTDFALVLAALKDTVPVGKLEDKLKADVCRTLALQDTDSPFYGKTKHPGAPTTGRYIAYISLFEVVDIFKKEVMGNTSDPTELAEVVKRSFKIIAELWPDAWDAPPGESRLTHGAGLRATASALAKLVVSHSVTFGEAALKEDETWNKIHDRFAPLQNYIAWTLTDAQKGTKTARDNYAKHIREAQNTRQDIEKLSDFLWTQWRDADAANG